MKSKYIIFAAVAAVVVVAGVLEFRACSSQQSRFQSFQDAGQAGSHKSASKLMRGISGLAAELSHEDCENQASHSKCMIGGYIGVGTIRAKLVTKMTYECTIIAACDGEETWVLSSITAQDYAVVLRQGHTAEEFTASCECDPDPSCTNFGGTFLTGTNYTRSYSNYVAETCDQEDSTASCLLNARQSDFEMNSYDIYQENFNHFHSCYSAYIKSQDLFGTCGKKDKHYGCSAERISDIYSDPENPCGATLASNPDLFKKSSEYLDYTEDPAWGGVPTDRVPGFCPWAAEDEQP